MIDAKPAGAFFRFRHGQKHDAANLVCNGDSAQFGDLEDHVEACSFREVMETDWHFLPQRSCAADSIVGNGPISV